MIEMINIIAYFLCVIIAMFGAIVMAGNLKVIKDNQEYIMFCIDRIEEHLSDLNNRDLIENIKEEIEKHNRTMLVDNPYLDCIQIIDEYINKQN